MKLENDWAKAKAVECFEAFKTLFPDHEVCGAYLCLKYFRRGDTDTAQEQHSILAKELAWAKRLDL